ncbi:zinc finger protein RFP-like [Seriola aureovittata]|uniref:zinc finger protein RFP-like n=1 Tax=Seriola aureovittata TaxID=2871759 RepID=UPI0024BE1573|nr:zinc finger protein RFP-like [Seriola aureovittata]
MVTQYVDMSAASCLLTEDQFLCSICLDVFTDPVALPCGHNFCNKCITEHWDVNVQCQCPICKRLYNTRPELHVNTFISEMAAQFRQSVQQKTSSSSSSEQQAAKPGEVPCDVCTGTKLKALKSCLVCLVSYCETHLEPHLTVSGLKRHQLIDPVENLEGRVCTNHDKLLELFCKTDQMCVCMLCTYSDHKAHDVVPLKEEYEGKKAELKETEAEIQQMIQKRRLKLQEIKRSVELSKERADRETAEGVQAFTALKESVERGQAEFIRTIKEKQRTTEKQAEDFIKELEQEISELKKRSSEVEQLSVSEDHLHLIQSFSSLNTAPPTKDWTEVSFCPPSYELIVRRSVIQLEKTLGKQIKKVLEVELKKVQQYAVDVILDPDIVLPTPTQSDDEQQVKEVDNCRCILSDHSLTSGRFYFEVQVSRWSMWTLGVATKSNMKRQITLSPSNGFWTVSLEYLGRYFAAADPPVHLSPKSKPQKVGVFVDYEEGLVSFYDTDTAALICSFTGCSFTDKLYPFFSPCRTDGDKIHIIYSLRKFRRKKTLRP